MPYKDPTQVRLALHYSYEYLRRVELVASSLRRKDALPDIYNSVLFLGKIYVRCVSFIKE